MAIKDARTAALDYGERDKVGIFGPNSWPDRLVEMDGPRSRLVIRARTAANTPAAPATPYLGTGGAALPSAILDFGDLEVAILESGNDAPIILPTALRTNHALMSCRSWSVWPCRPEDASRS